jgi:hypothetical protein
LGFILLNIYFLKININIFKLLKTTIFFKLLILFLSLFEVYNYINYFYFILYLCLIFGIYRSIKSNKNKKYIFNLFLKFIYVYIFWCFLADISFFLDLPRYYNFILIPAFLYFDLLSDGATDSSKFLVNDGVEGIITSVPFDYEVSLLIKSLVQRIASISFIVPTTTQPLILNWASGIFDIESNSFLSLSASLTSTLMQEGFIKYISSQGELSSSPVHDSTNWFNNFNVFFNLNGSNGPNFFFKGHDYSNNIFFSSKTSVSSPLPALPSSGNLFPPANLFPQGDSKDLISPDNLNLVIQKLFNAMNLEFDNYYSLKNKLSSIQWDQYLLRGEPKSMQWEDLFFFLKYSSILSDEDIKNLSLLLKHNNYNEFFKKIPRFLNYPDMLSGIYIFNDNIYLSKVMFDFYHGKNSVEHLIGNNKIIFVLDKNKSDFSNSIANTTLPSFLFEYCIPTISKSDLEILNNRREVLIDMDKILTLEDSLIDIENLNSSLNRDSRDFSGGARSSASKEEYYFFSSIFDLNNNKLKSEIDINNNNLISNINLEKCNNYWEFDFFKKYYYFWFIEHDIFSFISYNILKKLDFNLSDITPSIFMYAMHLAVVEYLEELDILLKAKIWYEHYTGINTSLLPESTLNEYRNWYLKFWANQIISFCKADDLESTSGFTTNMYDTNIVYLELLENIIFAQSKILEAQWTINTIYRNYDLSDILFNNQDETFRINFFNNIFTLFKKNILEEYSEIYDIRRRYQVERFHNNYPMNCDDLHKAYLYVKYFNDSSELTSKLNKENFNKTNK